MISIRKSMTWSLVAGMLLVNASCGGGDETPPREEVGLPPAPASPPPTSPSPSTSATAPPYEEGSPQRAAFDAINAARTQCGWGPLTRNIKLDLAAQGQADYQTARWNEGTGYQYVVMLPHSQVAGLSHFTGVTFAERLRAAQYDFGDPTSEVSAGIPLDQLPSSDFDRAQTMTESLMTTVYHMRAMVAKGTEFGVGFAVTTVAPTSAFNLPTATIVEVLGTPLGNALPPQTAHLQTYPCNGRTTKAAWSAGEWPNPIPSNLGWSLPFGPPIYLRSPSGTTLQVTSASITNYQGELFLMSHLNDPNARLQRNDGFVLLRSPLTPGQTYAAKFAGTIDGVPFTHAFTFSTK